MTTNSTKAELRSKFLAQRKALNPDDVASRSQSLSQKVVDSIDWKTCKTLHCFLPLIDDNEPNLLQVFEYAIDGGVGVYTSRPEKRTNRRVIEFETYNIPDYALSDNVNFDYIIAPMLAFDPKTNHRLGFGGGFYDRLIAQQADAETIGVCFKEFTTDISTEDHDQALNRIITG